MDLITILQQFENKVNVIKLKKINVIFQKLIPDSRDFISLTALEDRLHSFSKDEAESLQKFFFAFLKQTGKNFMSRRYFHMNLMAAASQNKFGINKMLHDNDIEEIQKSIEELKKSHHQEHNELSENQIGSLNNSYYQKNVTFNHQISSIHNGSTSTAHSTSRSQNISQNEGVPHIQVTLSISRPMNPDTITTDYQEQEIGPSFTLSGSTISGIPHNSSSTQISQFEEDHQDNHHNKSGFNSNRSLAKNMTFNPTHPSMNHNMNDRVLQEIKNTNRQGTIRSTNDDAEMNKKSVNPVASRDNLIKEYKENFQGKENFYHDFLELDNTIRRIERTNQSPTRTLASQGDPLVKQNINNPITDIASLRNLQEIIQIKNGKANQRKPSAPSSILSQVLKQEKGGDQIIKKRVGRSVSVNQINQKQKYLSNSPSCEKPTLRKMAPRFLILKPKDENKVVSRQYSNPEKENKQQGNKSEDKKIKNVRETSFKENILKRNSEQKIKVNKNQMDYEQFQQREQLMMNKRLILKNEQPIKTNKQPFVEQTNLKHIDPLSCRQNILRSSNELLEKPKIQKSSGYQEHYRIKRQLIGKPNCQSRRGSNELEAEIGDFFGNPHEDKVVGLKSQYETAQNKKIEKIQEPFVNDKLVLQNNQLNDISSKKANNLPLKSPHIIDAPQQGISPTCSTYFEKIIMQDESISKYFTSQNDEDSSSPSQQANNIKNQITNPFSDNNNSIIPFKPPESQPKLPPKQETNINPPRRASCVQTTQQWVSELRAESEQTALIQMQMEQLRKIQEAKQKLQAEEEQMIQQLANSTIIKTKPQLVSQFLSVINQEANHSSNTNILEKRQSLQSLVIPEKEFSNMNNYVYSNPTSKLPLIPNNSHNPQYQQYHLNNINSYPNNNANQRNNNINQYHDYPENTQTTNYQLSSYSSQTSKNENDIQGSVDSGYNYASHAAQKYTELDSLQFLNKCETGGGCYAGDQPQNSSLNFSFIDSQNN